MKISLTNMQGKLSRAEMRNVLGGSAFPEPLCKVVCSNAQGTEIGTNTCPAPDFICPAGSHVKSCICK